MTSGLFNTSRSAGLVFWSKADLDVRPAIQTRAPRPVRAVSTLRLRRGYRGASSRLTSPSYRPPCGFVASPLWWVDPVSVVRSSDVAGMLALRAAQRARHVCSCCALATCSACSCCALASLGGRPVHAPRDRSAAGRRVPNATRRRCVPVPRSAVDDLRDDAPTGPELVTGRRRREGRERLVPREVGGAQQFMRRTRDDPSLPASTQSRGRVDVGVTPDPAIREPGTSGTRTDAIRESTHDQRRAQR